MVSGGNPITSSVPGSPYQPGDVVRVVAAVDKIIHDVSRLVGQRGTVVHLEYDCGCGQRFPDVPMVGVEFDDGALEEFWPEELSGMKTAPASREE